MMKLTNLNKLKEKNSVLNFTTELNIDKQSLSLMYWQMITNLLYLHIKSLPVTIPTYSTTTVNVPKI